MNNQKPKIIYKYCSLESAERIIKDKQIKLTALSDVNDPFEALPQTGYIFKEYRNAENKFRELIQQKATEYQKAGKTIDAWEHNNSIQYKYFVAEAIHESHPWLNSINIAKEARKNIFCTCFSETYDNILMWSHYADQHRGCCIAFKSNHLKVPPFAEIQPVEYVDERPRLWDDDIQSQLDLPFKKNSMWSYEREWRLVLPAKEESVNPENGPFLQFGDSIVAVYFGARSEDFNKKGQFDKVLSAITKPIKKFIARADDVEYKLVFDEYKL